MYKKDVKIILKNWVALTFLDSNFLNYFIVVEYSYKEVNPNKH